MLLLDLPEPPRRTLQLDTLGARRVRIARWTVRHHDAYLPPKRLPDHLDGPSEVGVVGQDPCTVEVSCAGVEQKRRSEVHVGALLLGNPDGPEPVRGVRDGRVALVQRIDLTG